MAPEVFRNTFNPTLRKLFVEGASDRQDARKIGAVGGIEVEEKIVGMLLIVAAAGPGIVVDAAQAGEVEKRGEVVGDDVLDVLAFTFRRDGHGFNPFGNALGHILLEKSLAFDAVGITAQHQGAIFEEREKIIGDTVVVGDQIALGVAGLRKKYFVEMSEAEALAVEIERDGLLLAGEKFGFDLLFFAQNRAHDFGRANDRRAGAGGLAGRLRFPIGSLAAGHRCAKPEKRARAGAAPASSR